MHDHAFRLTLTTADRPVMYGWWRERRIADRKFSAWIGDYSGTPDVGVLLEEQNTDGTWRQVKAWPDQDSPGA